MKRIQWFVCVALAIGCVAAGDVAQAATYYVSLAGQNSNSGTAASPFRTINYGVSRLGPGDTLFVRAGVYNESLLYNIPSGTSWTNKVRIAAFQGESVTMRPTSGDNVLALAGSSNYGTTGEQKYIEFDGIDVDANGGVTHEAIKIEAGPGHNAHHIRIQNLTVTGNSNPSSGNANTILVTGLRADAIGFNEFINLVVTGGPSPEVGSDWSTMFYIQTPDNLIDGCTIHDGIGAGVQIYNSNIPGSVPNRTIVRNTIIRDFTRAPLTRAYGIIVARGNGHQIVNNLIVNIQHNSGYSSGLQVWTASNTEIYNNTFYGNAEYGILVIDPTTTGTIVRNNISYGNGSDYRNDSSSTTASNNLVGTDPRFVNAEAGNFQLQTSSPALNAGTVLSLVPRDLVGTPRPQGQSYDIGAYELSTGQTTTISVPTGLIIQN